MRTRPFLRWLTIALVAAVVEPLAAYGQPPAGMPAGQQPRPPVSPGPVRDPGGRPAASPTPAGKAVLAGTVTLAAGQPAAGARVMLNSGDGPGRTTTTDNSGRFVFEGLRTGRYAVMVSKPGYISISYGQRRAGGAGTQIPLNDGERRQIEIMLPRGAVITGMVLDERGEPAVNASVSAMRYTMMSGRRRGQQNGGGQTDDRGIYRMHSLQPGEYAVCAVLQHREPVNDAQRIAMDIQTLSRFLENAPAGSRGPLLDRLAQLRAQKVESTEPVMGYAPTCFPVSSPGPGSTIVVGAGEERTGIDIQLALTTVAKIEGTLVAPGGAPPRNVQLMLANAEENMSDIERQSAHVDGSGRFSFQSVPPGRYALHARTMFMGPPSPAVAGQGKPPEEMRLWGLAEVTVAGQDVSDVVIELQRGVTVSGQIVYQPTTLTPPSDSSRVGVSMFPSLPDSNNFMFSMGPNLQPRVDSAGRFTIPDVMPGKYRLTAGMSGMNWVIESITAGGQDVLDFPLEVRAGRDVSGVVITFGDRITELSGTVADSKGQPATEPTILLYSIDPKFWTPQSRRIRTVRAGDDGHYSFRNVPPGEYRLTTLVDPEPGAWFDRELLEQLDSSSIRIVLGEGEKKVEHVKVR